MIITNQTLQNPRTMVRGEFATQMAALLARGAFYQKLATLVSSNTRGNTYESIEKRNRAFFNATLTRYLRNEMSK